MSGLQPKTPNKNCHTYKKGTQGRYKVVTERKEKYFASQRLNRNMRSFMVAVMFLVFTVSISQGLEVGNSALEKTFTAGDKQIEFADFHGKSNLIVAGDAAKHPEFISQLERKTEEFKTTYDATVVRVQEEIGLFVIDKSGYVRWEFLTDAGLAQSAIGELEAELAKLKREKLLPIGSPAPDFRLIDAEHGIPFRLSNYKEKKHVLVTLLLQTY